MSQEDIDDVKNWASLIDKETVREIFEYDDTKLKFLGEDKYLPALEHIFGIVHKPWGSYSDILRNEKYVVKTISINPSESLSLQRHAKRSEFWYIISGYGTVQLGSLSSDMGPGQTIHIHSHEIHRATCTSSEPLVILELQYGEHCLEEDIERLEDNYGRG